MLHVVIIILHIRRTKLREIRTIKLRGIESLKGPRARTRTQASTSEFLLHAHDPDGLLLPNIRQARLLSGNWEV